MKPEACLAIPVLSTISCCETVVSEYEDPPVQWQHDILNGLLPSLSYVVSKDEKWFTECPATKRDKPDSHMNLMTFPMNPYEDAGYYCTICHIELANTFLHCQGCENLLQFDFNVCVPCYEAKQHLQCIDVKPLLTKDADRFKNSACGHIAVACDERVHVAMTCRCCCHGTSKSKRLKGEKIEGLRCIFCKQCRNCNCTCHTEFIVHRRFWDSSKLKALLASVEKLVGHGDVKHSPQAVEARLQKVDNSVKAEDAS